MTQNASWALVEAKGPNDVGLVDFSPLVQARYIKNPTEIQGFRNGYIRDAVAWVRWAAWIDEAIRSGKKINEFMSGQVLTKYREEVDLFMGLAYANISATNENAALPHYMPGPKVSRLIDRQTSYLVDAGAQYLDCTIDTTRTVHFGKPTKEQKRAFTRSLQGHIAIDSAIFPEGMTGFQLDSWARKAMWQDRMNYNTGTGHGVGSFLIVHEGQLRIDPGRAFDKSPFVAGQVISNEPGFYWEGHFGIRTETILAVQEVKTRCDFGEKKWLGFERITQIPIDKRLVKWSLMEKTERKWLKDHNRQCRDILLPLLNTDKRARRWLRRQ